MFHTFWPSSGMLRYRLWGLEFRRGKTEMCFLECRPFFSLPRVLIATGPQEGAAAWRAVPRAQRDYGANFKKGCFGYRRIYWENLPITRIRAFWGTRLTTPQW